MTGLKTEIKTAPAALNKRRRCQQRGRFREERRRLQAIDASIYCNDAGDVATL